MAGLGLDAFLNTNFERSSGGGNWLANWKKNKEQAITVWLCTHPNANIYPVWGHKFIEEGEAKEEGSDTKKPVLRFPSYVGPDTVEVYESQYFREGEALRVLPNKDPFLLLREWLRYLLNTKYLSADTVVFEWTDYKNNNKLIQWRAGVLSGLEERGKLTFGHSLDAKMEFIIPVVDNANLDAGPKLTRETKMVGLELRKAIEREMKSKGTEGGDPRINPYAFRWEYSNKGSFKDAYQVFRYDQAQYTDKVYEAITKEPPDATPLVKPGAGDMAKIRAAFEQAMQIALPLNLIFSEELEARRSVLRGAGAPGSATYQHPSAGTTARPPATPGAARPPANGTATTGPRPPGATGPARPNGPTPPATTQAAPPTRRQKVVEPPPVEMAPCTNCGKDFPALDTKCPHCGAEYEVEGASANLNTTSATNTTETVCEICGASLGYKIVETPQGPVETCKSCNAVKGDDVPF